MIVHYFINARLDKVDFLSNKTNLHRYLWTLAFDIPLAGVLEWLKRFCLLFTKSTTSNLPIDKCLEIQIIDMLKLQKAIKWRNGAGMTVFI